MRPSSPSRFYAVGLLALVSAIPGLAQEAAPPPAAPPHAVAPFSLKPLPERPIPDDPPPHEGALYDFPLTIQPPDILVVEALEALPGRDITGEHLVRPDGTISMGFYGDVHVRGLTVAQAKAKIVMHLRAYLTDATLGLLRVRGGEAPLMKLPETPAPAVPNPQPPTAEPEPEPTKPAVPGAARAIRGPARATRAATPEPRRVGRLVAQDDRPAAPVRPGKASASTPIDDVAEGFRLKPLDRLGDADDASVEFVPPDRSERVFVEFASFNSMVYYVQGDVGTPGRLPITGKETVLDALNFAGGFTPYAEPTDFHLHRPSRGGSPARDYRIDHAAILRGEVTANLQVFPGDRLVVGRKPIVARTVQLDQALAPFNSILNAAFQTAITARTIGLAGGDINGTNQAARDAAIRRFYDLLNNLPDGRADRFDARPLLDAPPLPTEPRPAANPGNPPTPPAGPEPR